MIRTASHVYCVYHTYICVDMAKAKQTAPLKNRVQPHIHRHFLKIHTYNKKIELEWTIISEYVREYFYTLIIYDNIYVAGVFICVTDSISKSTNNKSKTKKWNKKT